MTRNGSYGCRDKDWYHTSHKWDQPTTEDPRTGSCRNLILMNDESMNIGLDKFTHSNVGGILHIHVANPSLISTTTYNGPSLLAQHSLTYSK
jgi:hypothetical protein